MRVIFMGTPDFAVASLQKLVENKINVVAVITAPDKPVGRGQKLNESPVKKYALSVSIPVLQPEKLKSPGFLEELKSYNADLQIVVAFRMLPELVWAMPTIGTFNLHGSLLPQYRGAAPINWAIINGEKQTGVTTFFIEKEIDTGNIIFSKKIDISDSENAGSLHDRMMVDGADLVLETVNAIKVGVYPKIPQDFSSELKVAPKIFKETCKINWDDNTDNIFDFVRGLSPYPTAWTMLGDKVLKVFETEKVYDSALEIVNLTTYKYQSGTATIEMCTDHKKSLFCKTSDGYLALKEVQLEGKKRMTTEDFLRGFREF
jgi:methionyl-tRNA formyltransferase